MAMETLPQKKPAVPTKPMKEMEDGEVCFCVDTGDYVMCIKGASNRVIIWFLILNRNSTEETDGYSPDSDVSVRALQPGEHITVKFS